MSNVVFPEQQDMFSAMEVAALIGCPGNDKLVRRLVDEFEIGETLLGPGGRQIFTRPHVLAVETALLLIREEFPHIGRQRRVYRRKRKPLPI